MEYNQDHHQEKTIPQILQYKSIAHYFEDYFKYRKHLDEKFSFDMLAAELGFKSRSYVHMLIRGKKKISQQFINIFSKYLKLSTKESTHLMALCFYYNAENHSLKNLFSDKILENFDDPKNIIDIPNYEKFLSSKNAATLRLLIAFKDFKATEKNLKKFLNIDTEELKETLQLLEELQLIYRSETPESWTSSTKSFKVLGSNQNDFFKNYHLNTLQEAESILKSGTALTKFKSIFFALDEISFPHFTEEVDHFMRKMKLKYESAQLNQKHIFKMNVQAYPVTQKYEDT